MKFDLKLKAIFQDAMPGLLRVLELPAAKEYLTVEFPKRSKSLPDLVVRLVDDRILHIELQSKNDPNIVDRCLDYRLVIRRKWPGARICQVVIYMGSESLTMQSVIDEDDLRFRFTLVNFQEVPASVFLTSESNSERALAVLCASSDPRETIVQILGSWKHLPAKELRDRIDSLSVLSQLRKRDKIVEEEADRMPIEIDITENAFYKRATARGLAAGQSIGEALGVAIGEARGVAIGEARGVAIGEARGVAMGEARGVAIGEAKGEAKGEARAITRILEKRFGKLPAAVLIRIASADITTMDRWIDRLDDATSLDAIFAD